MADTFARVRSIIGTAEDWNLNDLVLGNGEIAIETGGTDVSIRMKVGDGVQTYSNLKYAVGNLWATSGANVTTSQLGGPVTIGTDVGTDRLTVVGGDYTIGVYRDTVPTDAQAIGIVKLGAWEDSDVPVEGSTIRGRAVGTWSLINHGADIEMLVTPENTTAQERALVIRSDQSIDVLGDRVRIRTTKTPASAADTGLAGEICWDSTYIYVCTATNTWMRSLIETW